MTDIQDPPGREIDSYLQTLVDQSKREHPLNIEWGQLAPFLDRPPAAELAVGLLLGRIGAAPLTLSIPDDKELGLAFVSGLAFALSNRPGQIEIAEGNPAERLVSSAWRRSWTPATRPAWVALLGESPPGLAPDGVLFGNGNGNGNGSGYAGEDEAPQIDALFGADHASFINPHRSRRSGGSESVFPLISRWLSNMIEEHEGNDRAGDESHKDQVLAAVRILLDELIQNIRGHATDRNGPPVHSMVRVQIKEDDGRPMARFAILDTGAGIITTVRPKLAKRGEGIEDHELIKQLFKGDLGEPWARARGIGLPKVWQVCTEQRARLTVTSGKARLNNENQTDQLNSQLSEFNAQGVAIVIDLPLLLPD